MSNEREPHTANSDALKPIEHALASYAPRSAAIDRDRLMFLAGRASAANPTLTDADVPTTPYSVLSTQARNSLWPAATTALAATSLALLATLLLRPTPQPKIVYRDPAISIATPVSPSQGALVASVGEGMPRFHPVALQARAVPSSNYVSTREVALRLGLDAIGGSTYRHGDPLASATYWELLEDIAHPKVQSPD